VSTRSCPSHSAMTVMSTPACSSRMAAVWRSVCGVTFFSRREGQTEAAVATCVASRCARASRLSGRPVRVGKDRCVRCAVTLGQPRPQGDDHRLGKRRSPLLAAFSETVDVRTLGELQICTAQAGQLGGAQPGLGREREDRSRRSGAVTATHRGRRRWCADWRGVAGPVGP
jgi:hypothetical protein